MLLQALHTSPAPASAAALPGSPDPNDEGPSGMPVYCMAFEWSMDLFEVSRYFPAAEKHALTESLRNTSRRICIHLSQAWRARHTPLRFAQCLAEADAAIAETRVWIDFAFRCQYITEEGCRQLQQQSRVLSRMLHALSP